MLIKIMLISYGHHLVNIKKMYLLRILRNLEIWYNLIKIKGLIQNYNDYLYS